MAAVLMLDLDTTIADREAAFLTWAESKAKQWAPNQPDAVAFLVEEDADGIRARDEFFALLADASPESARDARAGRLFPAPGRSLRRDQRAHAGRARRTRAGFALTAISPRPH